MTKLHLIIILFSIYLLKSGKLLKAKSINYPDYNAMAFEDKQLEREYLDYNEDNRKRFVMNNNDGGFLPECKPIQKSTTEHSTEEASTTQNPNSETSETTDSNELDSEADDAVKSIISILISMRHHAIALISNINELEMDLLSSSTYSENLEALCKNSSRALTESMYGMEKILYPDVLSQAPAPGYIMSEWNFPTQIKNKVLPETPQTNEFVSEAQDAVRSWKKQIEKCKHILDKAVHNALLKTNTQNDWTGPLDPLGHNGKPHKIDSNFNYNTGDLRQSYDGLQVHSQKLQKPRSSGRKIQNYWSIYDSFRKNLEQ